MFTKKDLDLKWNGGLVLVVGLVCLHINMRRGEDGNNLSLSLINLDCSVDWRYPDYR